MLLCDVRRGSRKAQVLGSPRMPNARWDHLSLRQGVEIMPTGMAPPREEGAGWARSSQILRPNYGFTLSSGYATYLTHPTTAQCQKLLGFSRRGVSLGDRSLHRKVHALEQERQRKPAKMPGEMPQKNTRLACVDSGAVFPTFYQAWLTCLVSKL